MKKLFSFIILCTLGLSLTAQDPPAGGQQMQQTPDLFIPLDTKNTSLVFRVNGRDGRLYQTYFGPKLDNTENLKQMRDAGHLAYATFGTDNLFEPAIRATHNDGNPSVELKYVSNEVENIRPDVTLTRIFLEDPEYPFVVTLFIRAFASEDVIEQWVEIKHTEKKPVTIFNYASSMLHFDADKYWLTQFHGDWAEEMKLQDRCGNDG